MKYAASSCSRLGRGVALKTSRQDAAASRRRWAAASARGRAARDASREAFVARANSPTGFAGAGAAQSSASAAPLAANDPQDLIAAPLHVLARDERLEREAQQRLGVRRAHVEVPVGVVDRDAVHMGDLPIAVLVLELLHLRLPVSHLGVDLARDEVLGPVALEQLAHLLALDAELLEHEQRRNRAAVGVVEVVEVVVAADLPAEDRALVAHAGLEEG